MEDNLLDNQEDGSKHALLVIGAGLPRTGTLSLKAALEHLLGGRLLEDICNNSTEVDI